MNGHASDPPELSMHMHQLEKKREPKRDQDGFYLFFSLRGTNVTEFYHKILFSTVRIWNMVIKFSDCVLIERK